MNPDEFYDDDFEQAVEREAEALNHEPYAGIRLQNATELVLTGAVTLSDDGSATVKSGSHTYTITPMDGCTCADSRYRSRYCKHFIAVELLKRVTQGDSPPSEDADPAVVPNTPCSASWAVHEAPASCCLKFQASGVECLYTMRDTDDELLFARVQRILPKLMEGLMPTEAGATPPVAPDYCPIHQVQMKQYSKDDEVWYSHRLHNFSVQ
jgi:hypothetical protein